MVLAGVLAGCGSPEASSVAGGGGSQGDGATTSSPPGGVGFEAPVGKPSSDPDPVPATARPEATNPPDEPIMLDDLDLLIDYDRFGEDTEFFQSFGAPGADWLVRFESAEEMAAESHAIILGTVVDNVEGPSFGPEHLEDDTFDEGEGEVAFTLTAYKVRVDAVLAGALPVGDRHVLVGPGGPPLPTGEMGPAVMFLWWGGQAHVDGSLGNTRTEEWNRSGYRLTSPQGVFVAGPEGALNVGTIRVEGFRVDEPEKYVDPVAEAVRYTQLADLVHQVSRYETYDWSSVGYEMPPEDDS